MKQKTRERFPGFLFQASISPNNQVQVITPPIIEHVFADCVCVAVALHEGGGPATPVTTIVTFCEGVKPWRGAAIVAVPEKYAPLLSAAYCSSYVATLRRSDFIAATYALSFVLANFGIAIAARMPMMTTTIEGEYTTVRAKPGTDIIRGRWKVTRQKKL